MAQVMHANTLIVPTSTDKKTYAVNIKGLIAHILDILFVSNEVESTYYSSDLSSHMQKDLGIMR
ncbi:hypothetical protein L3V77_17605 [Vibrio sp. DW001]|jgi:hypothetical protein|uniref:hypothetical protein n=1 Tax=unclassified Vibrio TaxID=2614977 RepID=UPI00189E1154|nr:MULTISPECIES: hypothetical protein [unclassified Vibrio]UGA57117.1 hypothetical protein IUZ65_023310 [Vibrio sp. VB16]WED29247.1 hypothetical protein L3V77_17605 [Vibrio sp. DW001]